MHPLHPLHLNPVIPGIDTLEPALDTPNGAAAAAAALDTHPRPAMEPMQALDFGFAHTTARPSSSMSECGTPAASPPTLASPYRGAQMAPPRSSPAFSHNEHEMQVALPRSSPAFSHNEHEMQVALPRSSPALSHNEHEMQVAPPRSSPALLENDHVPELPTSPSAATDLFDRPPVPSPHLPLRKKSSQALRQRAASPLSSLRNASSISIDEQLSPSLSTFDSRSRRSSLSRACIDEHSSLSSPTSTQDDAEVAEIREAIPLSVRSRPRASSHTHMQPLRTVRVSASIPNLAQLRQQHRETASTTHKFDSRRTTVRDSYLSLLGREPPNRALIFNDESRSSCRSGYASSGFLDASGTERSSIASQGSHTSDSGYVGPEHTDVEEAELEEDEEDEDEGMTVEDCISMYEHGFADDPPEEEVPDTSDEGYSSQVPARPDSDEQIEPPKVRRHSTSGVRDSALGPELIAESERPLRNNRKSRHSRLVSSHAATLCPAEPADSQLLTAAKRSKTFTQIITPRPASENPMPRRMEPISTTPVPRDRYGFKKTTQYINEQQYDAWNAPYTEYIDRRRKKWVVLMRQYGLSTDNPVRFPPRTEKVKRYIRKGVPPEWRGAAWFWYAGGPSRMAQSPGLYWELIEQVNADKLSELDREHIERDLNRTFPDNVKFRPDNRNTMNLSKLLDASASELTADQETPILRALRRVLQAFAVYNPGIGYCQSLNFLAGLLLIFLDEDEEKAFIMLDIITSVHLPGTHSRVLEANIDIGVLMSCIRESMPAIWNKIDDTRDADAPGMTTATARLPTVSLAMTSWFMSLFVGNFPIETVLRVWDSFFYEGSKTLFRIALTILKVGEDEIRRISDPMEIFQIIQTIPRRLIDANALMEACFKRRNGFGHVSQDTIDSRRVERRKVHRANIARINSGVDGSAAETMDERKDRVKRAASRRFKRARSKAPKQRSRTDRT